jgi:hypothetical protein
MKNPLHRLKSYFSGQNFTKILPVKEKKCWCWVTKFTEMNQHSPTHHYGWMVGGQDTFFSLGSCPPANPLIAKCSKSVLGVLKLGFIQLDDLKMGKWG